MRDMPSQSSGVVSPEVVIPNYDLKKEGKPATRLFGPDLIRATAILCVVFSHTLPGATTFALIGGIRGILGFVGVEIFFVLSGYLIGGILLKQLFEGTLDSLSGLSGFWKRRWFRTLPNYYLFLLLNLLLARIAEGALPPSAWKFFWFGEALTSEHPRFFTVAWSLAVEEWFYFSFPLLLWLTMKIVKSRSLAFWLTVTGFLLVPLGLRWFMTVGNWDGGLRKVTFFRLDAIMFGVILAFLQQRPKYWQPLLRVWPIGVAGMAGLIIYAFLASEISVHSFFDRVLYFDFVSLSLMLIFPAVIVMQAPGRMIGIPIEKISLWSYSMYLSHAWLAEVLRTLFVTAGWSIHGINAVLISSLIWSATIAFSAFLYAFYEKPLMDLRDCRLKCFPSLRSATGSVEGK
jgi:peptidoglycan/LPS O-acetylase OafA/YrhL